MKVLETERLTLRWFDEGDAAFILALVNDPDWLTNIGDRNVHSLDDARRFIADRLAASYWDKGHGLWAMERREDGALVGMCGLIDRDTLPEIDVGYALAPAFRRQGYAREAASACLAYARDVLARPRVLAIVSPANAPSRALLESLGMRVEDTAPETVRYTWSPDRAPPDDIEALVRRFFAAFSNRGKLATIAAVPSMFVRGAMVTITAPLSLMDVRTFLAPRAVLLQSGALVDFEEEATIRELSIHGDLASVFVDYRSAGRREGAPFEAGGTKHFQIVQTPRGPRIASLAWSPAPPSS